MTSNDKQLLLVDLSARLPYNIAIDCRSEDSRFTCYLTTDMLREIQNNRCYWEYKPYLFPLSSMTEEQKNECFKGTPLEIDKYGGIAVKDDLYGGSQYTDLEIYLEVIDWLNANHFDYRGLIEKGLAIDATGLNIY